MRFLFVVNPRAGRVEPATLRLRLATEFRAHDFTIVDDVPSRSLLAAMVPKPTVVAVGGDGTVQRILQRVGAPFPCRLGVLPLGTANDLARASGIPTNLSEACVVLRRGRVQRIDVLEVNGVPFVTAGGLGLPSAVAERANRLRASRFAGLAARACRGGVYPVAALLELLVRPRPVLGHVEGVTGERERNWAMIVVSNQPLLGGFRPSPAADPCDGRLDLCAIEAPRRRVRLAWLVWCILRGKVARSREARAACSRSVIVRTTRPADFLGDGETLHRGMHFEICVRPAALPLVCGRARGCKRVPPLIASGPSTPPIRSRP